MSAASTSRGTAAELREREREALVMAAGGFVSGTLSEWPLLARAFRVLGEPAAPSMGLAEMKARARELLGRPDVQGAS
jgi:hypothetical protein